jgi:ribosomal protein S9
VALAQVHILTNFAATNQKLHSKPVVHMTKLPPFTSKFQNISSLIFPTYPQLFNFQGLFDVNAHVHGGGKSGQAQALRHGIARVNQNP